MILSRRSFLARSSALATVPAAARATAAGAAGKPVLPAFYGDIEERTFRWFWDSANRANGLVPDRSPRPSFCSIAAVGFALGAYAAGAERGWCRRADAAELTLTAIRFLWNAPQGPQASGVSGYKGFFYHFLDMETGCRFRDVELSSVDSTILFLGALFAAEYYDGDASAEREIRELANKLYARADWTFFRSDGRRAISMGWHPEQGLIPANWVGYNEGMMVNILALGAPDHPLPPEVWTEWTATYPDFWRGEGPTRHLGYAPLFVHQYSQLWVDFRGIYDAPMRSAGFDYFENSRRATLANWAWCAKNPMGWDGYSNRVWGLTACDGPGSFELMFRGEKRQFLGYSARGPLTEPAGVDDGTIAPTAALGSLPFAPEIVIPTAGELIKRPGLFRHYGFVDAFNPSFRDARAKVDNGSVDPVHGWIDDDFLGIDQGPILLQAANYRSELIWSRTRRSPAIRRGLLRAGFTGGWLHAAGERG